MRDLKIDDELAEMFEGFAAQYRPSGATGANLTTDLPVFNVAAWQQMGELGLTRLTGDEEAGGSGATWAEASHLIGALVGHGVRTPYVEHDLLASFFADKLSLAGAQIMTAVEVEPDAPVYVSWLGVAERVLLIWHEGQNSYAASVAVADLSYREAKNNIGEPGGIITVDGQLLASLAGVRAEISPGLLREFRLKRDLVRAVQVSAALDAALAITVEHVKNRVQFGRSLAKFQAVQNLLADMAAENSLATVAVNTALLEAINSGWESTNLEFLIAVARSVAGHSASVVVRNAHQAHGAIGTTIEYELHHFTRAALVWRAEYGSVSHWDAKVTEFALQSVATGLWPLVSGTSV